MRFSFDFFLRTRSFRFDLKRGFKKENNKKSEKIGEYQNHSSCNLISQEARFLDCFL